MKRYLLFVVALAIACSNARHVAVVADSAVFQILNDVHAAEQTALCGKPSCANVPVNPTVPGWTAAKSVTFNQKLLPAVDAGRQFNAVLKTWRPGTPVPQQITDLTNGIANAVTAVTADFPDSSTKSTLLAGLATAQKAVLDAITLYFSIKG